MLDAKNLKNRLCSTDNIFLGLCLRVSFSFSPESGERLVVVDVGRGEGGHHGRLAVAAQVLSQQPGQHGVAVRNKLGLLLLLGGLTGRGAFSQLTDR